MSLNAAALKMMADKGFTSQEIAEFAALLEEPRARSKAAERQARYRKRKADLVTDDVTSDVTCDATGDVTPPPNERDNLTPCGKSSEPKGSSSKIGICFPADWQVPPVAELTPKARACAEQWSRSSYETEAEGFSLYWSQSRKRRPDWNGTWCAWVIRQHSKVMRDQKFGNAAPSGKVELSPQQLRERAEWFIRHGQPDRADECRQKAIKLEQRASA